MQGSSHASSKQAVRMPILDIIVNMLLQQEKKKAKSDLLTTVSSDLHYPFVGMSHICEEIMGIVFPVSTEAIIDPGCTSYSIQIPRCSMIDFLWTYQRTS